MLAHCEGKEGSRKDGCPMNNVGHDHVALGDLRSFPRNVTMRKSPLCQSGEFERSMKRDGAIPARDRRNDGAGCPRTIVGSGRAVETSADSGRTGTHAYGVWNG